MAQGPLACLSPVRFLRCALHVAWPPLPPATRDDLSLAPLSITSAALSYDDEEAAMLVRRFVALVDDAAALLPMAAEDASGAPNEALQIGAALFQLTRYPVCPEVDDGASATSSALSRPLARRHAGRAAAADALAGVRAAVIWTCGVRCLASFPPQAAATTRHPCLRF